jgi:uncharacterized membrane protein
MNYQDPNEHNPYGGYHASPPPDNQQPPYRQQQPPYGEQPYGIGDTSMGLTENKAILVSYAFWWVTGLFVFFAEKKNRLVRFHAMQSTLLFGGVTIALFVLGQLNGATLYGLNLLFSLAINLIWLLAGALWLFLLFNAWQGRYYRLPFIGDYAEKLTASIPNGS